MDWLSYFTHNRAHRHSIPWDQPVTIDPHLRAPLIPSLQRFQIGETGDGAHLKKVAASTGDPYYVAAIDLFVEEEREHAALTGRLLTALDAPLLTRHWTDKAFRLLCVLSNLPAEPMVILVAEIIALRYFHLLYRSIPDNVLRATCAQILSDEEGHIAFHSDTLRPRLSTLPPQLRSILRLAWGLFFRAVCLVVVYDHRALLRASKLPLGSLLQRMPGPLQRHRERRLYTRSGSAKCPQLTRSSARSTP